MSRAPGWRLRVEHTTTFDYSTAARASYNEVRQVPGTTTRQTTLEWKVATAPAAPQYAYRDYWGTRVVAFDVAGPHHQLIIHTTSLVDTQPPVPRPDGSWADVEARRDHHVEYLEPSVHAGDEDELREAAVRLRSATPALTVVAVADWVHRSLDYVPGVTNARTTATEAFGAGRGVCQDFAHLALSLLRGSGIPARYVSGYLHPDAEAAVGASVTGESHAWIEAWTGGWWGFDPTNDIEIGLRHVVVARGRDYADVPPVRGIFAGGGDHKTSVAVALDEDGMTERLAVRIWLPDRPGMLAAVATRIAGLEGNVIGLEVLERSGGVAVYELMVELPRAGLGDELSARLQAIDGAGVEEVRVVPDDAEERGLQVISAAVSILETANATASLAALIGLADDLFGAEWSALVELRTETCVERKGEVPPLDWMLAFLAGARSAPSATGTSGSGVMAGELVESGLALCIGRSVAFRGREQRELDMLVRVADRMCRPLRADRIPQTWSAGRPWPAG